LELAKTLGADATFDVQTSDLVSGIRELTGGRLADVAIDVSGGGAVTLTQAMHAVRKGGTVVSASGAVSPTDVTPFDIDALRKKQLTLRGVRGHSFAAVESAMAMIAAGDIPMTAICAPSFPLDRIDEAFRQAGGENASRAPHVSITPWA
jgi:threonine dehydrogenase-like Zn-dependent dehydrogenase